MYYYIYYYLDAPVLQASPKLKADGTRLVAYDCRLSCKASADSRLIVLKSRGLEAFAQNTPYPGALY